MLVATAATDRTVDVIDKSDSRVTPSLTGNRCQLKTVQPLTKYANWGASPVAVNISIMIFRILLNHAAMGHGCLCSAYDKGLDH